MKRTTSKYSEKLLPPGLLAVVFLVFLTVAA
jgi:hypothetical protein